MGILCFFGNALLSVVVSLAANAIDRFMQSRKKKKSPHRLKKSS